MAGFPSLKGLRKRGRDNLIHLKGVYMAEKSGADPLKKWCGPHNFLDVYTNNSLSRVAQKVG